MSGSRFGTSPTGLLQRLRPGPVDVADLLDVAATVLPGLAVPGLRAEVVRSRGAGTELVLEEDERSTRIPAVELADDMAHAGVAATPGAIAAALTAWVASRPVADRAAAAHGVAVLDWTDPGATAVGWQVVVRRGDVAPVWTPSAAASPAAVQRTRAAALGRARDVELQLRIEGPVALWSHPTVPLLATAALVAPQRLAERAAAAGLVLTDMHVVVTPHRPVACAGAAVAARLSGETSEPSLTLPWTRLADLPWGPAQEM